MWLLPNRHDAFHFINEPLAGGKGFAVLGTVLVPDSKEDYDTGFDLGHTLVADIDAGRADTLNDRAR